MAELWLALFPISHLLILSPGIFTGGFVSLFFLINNYYCTSTLEESSKRTEFTVRLPSVISMELWGGAVSPYFYNAPPISLDFSQCTPFILLTDDLINCTKM